MEMFEYVEATAGKFPDNTAYQFMGRGTTYSEFSRHIDRAAKALTAIGVKENDIICVAMPNVPQAITLIYAANKIGAVVNMLHPLSSENEFREYINRVNAETILILDQFYAAIKAIRSETSLKNIIVAQISEALGPAKKQLYKLTEERKYRYIKSEENVIIWNDFIRLGDAVRSLPCISDRSDEPALILNSGGTTGKSKGVCLSNNNVNEAALQMIEANPMLCAKDRFLSIMPIFHGNGLVVGIHVHMIVGSSCVLIPRFTPDSYAKDLLKNRCNYMSGVPALFEKLMYVDAMKDADLSFLKGVFSGADYLSVELERKINIFLAEHNSPVRVRQGYGMTEGVVATTLNPAEATTNTDGTTLNPAEATPNTDGTTIKRNESTLNPAEATPNTDGTTLNPAEATPNTDGTTAGVRNKGIKEGSIGIPLNGVDVKIVEPGTERELAIGEVGEIVFSSATNMLHYYNDPEETANTLRKHSDGKYWIHSGDLGTEDEDGYFYFKGRIKRMITVNGYNVFPNELENIIEGFDIVDRCCVLGVRHTEGSRKIKAFIVLNKGYSATDETKQAILEQCRKHIAKYALPKEIEFIPDIPKTKVGKVDVNALSNYIKD